MNDWQAKAYDLTRFLIGKASLSSGDCVVLGCSTSEVMGERIGTAGSEDVGEAIVRGVLAAACESSVSLCVQCCEHLNRALVTDRQTAMRRHLPVVSAVPKPHAGGSAAAAAWRLIQDPVLVEFLQAEAAMDIGETLIGMHVQPVAVPVRVVPNILGKARVTMAITRPKYIGGPRAQYD